MWPIAVLVAVAIMIHSPSWADVYKCPDGKGSVRYQNMPCVGETAPLFESQPAAPPSESPAVPAPPLPDAMPSVPPPPPGATSLRQDEAQPIDMRQFDQLKIGMSEAQVHAVVGPPERITGPRRIMTPVRTGGGIVMVESVLTGWHYPGTRQTWTTTLEFADGVLVDKRREH